MKMLWCHKKQRTSLHVWFASLKEFIFDESVALVPKVSEFTLYWVVFMAMFSSAASVIFVNVYTY